MTMPQVWCEIAFTRDGVNDSYLWRDVSGDVEWQEGLHVTRRRSHELDEVQPGTLSLTLKNEDGRYTAGNASSPFYPNVKINRPIRIRTRWPVSVNLLLEAQAKASNASLFSATQGTLAVDAVVVPAGQTSSIRWSPGTLSVGALLRVGATSIVSATDQALPVEVGATYSVRCQVRRDASVTTSVAVRVRWYDDVGDTISDSTGSAVALTTTFQAASVSATAPAGAVWARVSLVSTTGSASAVVVYASAWQMEQAAAPTTWVSPGVEYIRFSGFVDKWPHSWQNGVSGQVSLTATDRFKLLERNIVRFLLSESILLTSPTLYYPLGEGEDSTLASSVATVPQPDLQVGQIGAGGTLAFGAASDPGGHDAPEFAPASAANGKFLQTTLSTPIGGPALSFAVWAEVPGTTASGNPRLITLDYGAPDLNIEMLYEPAGNLFRVGWRWVPGIAALSATVPLGPGLHLFVVTMERTGSQETVKGYVDNVLEINHSVASTNTEWVDLDRLSVGGFEGGSLSQADLFDGTLSHVMAWNRVLDIGDIQDLWDAGGIVAAELSGARIQRIAELAGVSDLALDAGSSQVASDPIVGESALQTMKKIALSDAGMIFVGRNGTLTFHGRARRQSPGAELITVSADQCGQDLSFIVDDQLLINDVQVKIAGGASVRAVDEGSQEEYGAYYKTVDTLLTSGSEAADRANYMLGYYAEPRPRAGQITFEGRSVPSLLPQMLNSDIGQQIRVTSLPAAAPVNDLTLWLEGVKDTITDQTWHFTFDTSPVSISSLILDDPVQGLLDSNYLGW